MTKPGRRRVVYTNIGLGEEEHRLLKHLAAEEGKGLGAVVREAISAYLESKRRGAVAYEDSFIFQLGRGVRLRPDRPYRRRDWSEIDRDLYGGSPHGE